MSYVGAELTGPRRLAGRRVERTRRRKSWSAYLPRAAGHCGTAYASYAANLSSSPAANAACLRGCGARTADRGGRAASASSHAPDACGRSSSSTADACSSSAAASPS